MNTVQYDTTDTTDTTDINRIAHLLALPDDIDINPEGDLQEWEWGDE